MPAAVGTRRDARPASDTDHEGGGGEEGGGDAGEFEGQILKLGDKSISSARDEGGLCTKAYAHAITSPHLQPLSNSVDAGGQVVFHHLKGARERGARRISGGPQVAGRARKRADAIHPASSRLGHQAHLHGTKAGRRKRGGDAGEFKKGRRRLTNRARGERKNGTRRSGKPWGERGSRAPRARKRKAREKGQGEGAVLLSSSEMLGRVARVLTPPTTTSISSLEGGGAHGPPPPPAGPEEPEGAGSAAADDELEGRLPRASATPRARPPRFDAALPDAGRRPPKSDPPGPRPRATILRKMMRRCGGGR